MDSFRYVLVNVYYGSAIVGAVLGQSVLRKYGVRKSMVISGFGHFVVVAVCILPAWKYEYPLKDDSFF